MWTKVVDQQSDILTFVNIMQVDTVPCVRRCGLEMGSPSTEHWFPHGYKVILPALFSM